MTKQMFILITTIVAAGVALAGIGGQIGDHAMSLVGSGIAAVGAIAWFAKSWRRKAKLVKAGGTAAGGFLAFSIIFLALGAGAAFLLDGVASNWVQAFGLSMAIVTTVLFAVYAASSEQVIDIEAIAKEQQVHNLRSRLAAAQEDKELKQIEPAEAELGESEN